MITAQAAAGEPMTLRQEPSLSFGRIADAWAQETADQVGALTRDEIITRLIAALRSGEFDEALDAGDLYLQFRPDPIDGGDQDCDWFRLWTCDGEPAADGPMELSPMSRRHRADAITINMLARLFSDRADAASRNRAWLDLFEQAEITRGAFSSWVFHTGRAAPAFWFASSMAAAVTVGGNKRGRKPHEAGGLVVAALETIAYKRRKDPRWLKDEKVAHLRRLVLEAFKARLRDPNAAPIQIPGETRMLQIITEWRNAKLGRRTPRAEFANSAAPLP